LTPHGHQTLSQVWADRVNGLREELADFSDAELARAAVILSRIAAAWAGPASARLSGPMPVTDSAANANATSTTASAIRPDSADQPGLDSPSR
jgi:hypothetical protein